MTERLTAPLDLLWVSPQTKDLQHFWGWSLQHLWRLSGIWAEAVIKAPPLREPVGEKRKLSNTSISSTPRCGGVFRLSVRHCKKQRCKSHVGAPLRQTNSSSCVRLLSSDLLSCCSAGLRHRRTQQLLAAPWAAPTRLQIGPPAGRRRSEICVGSRGQSEGGCIPTLFVFLFQAPQMSRNTQTAWRSF